MLSLLLWTVLLHSTVGSLVYCLYLILSVMTSFVSILCPDPKFIYVILPSPTSIPGCSQKTGHVFSLSLFFFTLKISMGAFDYVLFLLNKEKECGRLAAVDWSRDQDWSHPQACRQHQFSSLLPEVFPNIFQGSFFIFVYFFVKIFAVVSPGSFPDVSSRVSSWSLYILTRISFLTYETPRDTRITVIPHSCWWTDSVGDVVNLFSATHTLVADMFILITLCTGMLPFPWSQITFLGLFPVEVVSCSIIKGSSSQWRWPACLPTTDTRMWWCRWR